MTSSQIKTILALADIPENKWTEIKNIKQFDLINDGNQVITDFHRYYFNTEANLLLVKEYYFAKNEDQIVLREVSSNKFDVSVDFAGISSVLYGEPYHDPKDFLRQKVYENDIITN